MAMIRVAANGRTAMTATGMVICVHVARSVNTAIRRVITMVIEAMIIIMMMTTIPMHHHSMRTSTGMMEEVRSCTMETATITADPEMASTTVIGTVPTGIREEMVIGTMIMKIAEEAVEVNFTTADIMMATRSIIKSEKQG
jgi:hypothetical protein